MNPSDYDEILKRLARIESRLCQVMLHFGLDPAEKHYDHPRTVPLPESRNTGSKVWRARNRSP